MTTPQHVRYVSTFSHDNVSVREQLVKALEHNGFDPAKLEIETAEFENGWLARCLIPDSMWPEGYVWKDVV
jgi:hypothetical protein